MTHLITIEFITQLFNWYIEFVPLILITLLIFKLLRLASGWQPKKHKHQMFEVS